MTVTPAPVPAETVRYEKAEAPPPPSSARPIDPSPGLGRFVIFILVGLLILLLLLFYQGKLDRQKLDPRKWDPKRKLASIQPAPDRFQQSAISSPLTLFQLKSF